MSIFYNKFVENFIYKILENSFCVSVINFEKMISKLRK